MDNEGLVKAENSKYWPFNLPLQFDANIWYIETSRDCKGIRHYPVGNAHTFAGRMLVWCPKNDSLIYRSLSEMSDMSEACQIWVRGFLCGNEPEYPLNSKGDLSKSAAKRHDKKLAKFHKTGVF